MVETTSIFTSAEFSESNKPSLTIYVKESIPEKLSFGLNYITISINSVGKISNVSVFSNIRPLSGLFNIE